jgi:two-component system cell cycle sensor histidine kinase/response regulator CckA
MIDQLVLLVEDESIVRNFVTVALERENFIVLPAPNGAEALEVSRNHIKIDLLLTDGHIGGDINGIELAERIVEEKPEIKVLVMSGFPDTESEARQKRLPFLRKPFTHAELTERVRKVLKAPARSQAGQRGR